MKICKSIAEIKKFTAEMSYENKKIGLVPTMGFLHEGHLELMRHAGKECDVVIVSIFVNPTQFCPGEDFKDYPRDLDKDSKLAEGVGVDVIFAPDENEMYPESYSTYVEVTGITEKLCGGSRPGHFRGVTTVVNKLFNIIKPHTAYFGQKDFQQVLVIKRMVQDLNIDIEIKTVPIVREKDNIAMSSRNLYLNDEERKTAAVLYKSMLKVKDLVEKGERDVKKLKDAAVDLISSEPLTKIDYVEILTIPDLQESDILKGKMLYALAVKVGKARLIDNTVLEVE
jgi:pantoate--beta-alanine ligase